jgi:hypothetical protein
MSQPPSPLLDQDSTPLDTRADQLSGLGKDLDAILLWLDSYPELLEASKPLVATFCLSLFAKAGSPCCILSGLQVPGEEPVGSDIPIQYLINHHRNFPMGEGIGQQLALSFADHLYDQYGEKSQAED